MFALRNPLYLVLAVAALCCLSSSASASTFTIDTGPPTSTISTFGFPNTATYGQTVTAVAGNTQLDSFSFHIRSNGTTITYRAFVMAWDGTKATGPVLFQSSDQLASSTTLTQYTYNTGGINLIAGQQYVLFASVSNNYVAGNGSGSFGSRTDNNYAGGLFVFNNNSGDFGALSTVNWSQNFQCIGCDLAFTANFSPSGPAVPEPATLVLLGSGLAGLIAKRRRLLSTFKR